MNDISYIDIKEKKEMTTIYLLRHGESEANLGDRFAGHTDANLTEKGFKQARLAGEYLNQYDIDVIYASPLKRAYNTAKPISDLKKLPIVTDEGLMEINGGGWENLSFLEIKAKFPNEYGLWMNDIGNARCNDGESLKELYDRVVKTITKIATENSGKTICIATHATPIRVFECFSQGKDVSYTNDIEWVPNASVTAFSFDGQKFTQIFRAENTYLKDIATKLPTDI